MSPSYIGSCRSKMHLKNRVSHILHETLGMIKLSTRWLPHLLTSNNKDNHDINSKLCLKLFKRNPKEIMRTFATVGETWFLWLTPNTKKQCQTVDFARRTCFEKSDNYLNDEKVMLVTFSGIPTV